jgi:hypothetical protein
MPCRVFHTEGMWALEPHLSGLMLLFRLGLIEMKPIYPD